MKSRSPFHGWLLALVTALALVACSDDDDPAGGGTPDTTPPGVASVTAVDAGHVVVVFSEAVTRASAEDTDNYSIVVAPSPLPSRGTAAGGGIPIVAASLGSDNKTVDLSTLPMSTVNYNLIIQGVRDSHGNSIDEQVSTPFAGSNAADVTAPELVYRKPGPGATNVSTTSLIELTFSEPIQLNTLEAGFGMSSTQGVVPVTFSSTDNTHFSGSHDLLDTGEEYDINLSGVLDVSGNAATDYSWSFHTTTVADQTPPTLVSSIPANLATSVDVNSELSLTFSEAIDPNTFTPLLVPDVTGTASWSLDGKTVTFVPSPALDADTQYELEIFPGDAADLAGNTNTNLYSVVFTTGAALEGGSIAGTLTGDPNSTGAADPTGGFSAVADAFPFSGGPFNVYGATTVAGNNTYTNRYLRDFAAYYPLCIKDTGDDGLLDPLLGDAFGLYGIDLVVGDMTPLTVDITGGSDATGINFPLYDPTAVYGEVYYKGAYAAESHAVYIGVFEAAGFDPNTSEPVASTEASWPDSPFYVINSVEAGAIPNGNYYVGAFLDANDSGFFDPATDPAGLFGGAPPTAINLANGSDGIDKDILIGDPAPGLRSSAVQWKGKAPRTAWLRHLSDAVRAAQPR